ncbi:MAG: serine hydrolase domain-containing protein [Gemmatimonadales bacterium]
MSPTNFRARSFVRSLPLAAGIALSAGFTARQVSAQAAAADAETLEHTAAMAAHHLCSGIFVVGRDYQRTPEQVLEQDVKRFPEFNWQDNFEYRVDMDAHTATVWGSGFPARTAKYHGDQGCTILARDEEDVHFRPVRVPRNLPDAATVRWPMGDVDARGPLPPGADAAKFDAALDWAMNQGQNTRALVVTYKSKIIGERYAPGFTKDTPQISWSMGKSITAALVGILVQRGELQLDEPAPVAAWQKQGDPRRDIKIKDLMHMSSGLDFKNRGLNGPDAWRSTNEHFLIYFDAINVFDHAVNQPLDISPNTEFRYRNSDPLTLGRIVRETVEADGENYLTFPQRALFDKIGARNYVLETDTYGNFIMTGYDYGSAWDWTRFGLLHLWRGVWNGERILPEGWVHFVSTPTPTDPRRGYGGLFWLNRGGAMDRVPRDAFWAAGHMGQTTMIIPSKDMVVVRLGPSPGGFNSYFNDVVGNILEAIEK